MANVFGYTAAVSSVISRAMNTTIPFRVRSAQIETFRFPSGNYFLQLGCHNAGERLDTREMIARNYFDVN